MFYTLDVAASSDALAEGLFHYIAHILRYPFSSLMFYTVSVFKQIGQTYTLCLAGDNKTKEEGSGSTDEEHKAKIMKATGSPSRSASSTPSSTPKHEKRLLKAPNELVKDGISSVPTDNDFMYVEVEKASSVLPTMWLGSQSGR